MSAGSREQAEFRRILHNGLGRALLHLRDHDAAPHREALLHACLHNTVLDRQVEGGNAAYIFEAIGLTGEVGFYRDALLRGLQAPEPLYDLGQICDLLRHFAQAGDRAARRALYDEFDRAGSGASEAMFSLVELDGLAGLLHIAETVGPQATTDDDFWEGGYLLGELRERYSQSALDAALGEACARSPRVAAYVAAIERQRDRKPPPSRPRIDTPPVSYGQLKGILAGHRSWSYTALRRWGTQASEEDLTGLAHDLLAETDPVRLSTALAAFAQRPFPLGHAPLLQFIDNPNPRITHAAFNALGNIRHPDVRALALRLLPTHRAWAALDLLLGNYEQGDHPLIEASLEQLAEQGEDEKHWLEFGVVDLFEKYPAKVAATSLLLVYEYGRCSYCRERSVRLLHQLDALPELIREECEYDANFDLRDAARRRFQAEKGRESSALIT